MAFYDHPTSQHVGDSVPAAKPTEQPAATDRERALYPTMTAQQDRDAAAREVFADVDLGQSSELVDIIQQFADQPPSAEQQRQWEQQAIDELRREFGYKAADALADASALAKKGGRIIKILEARGLANHPRVVVRLAHAARRRK